MKTIRRGHFLPRQIELSEKWQELKTRFNENSQDVSLKVLGEAMYGHATKNIFSMYINTACYEELAYIGKVKGLSGDTIQEYVRDCIFNYANLLREQRGEQREDQQ